MAMEGPPSVGKWPWMIWSMIKPFRSLGVVVVDNLHSSPLRLKMIGATGRGFIFVAGSTAVDGFNASLFFFLFLSFCFLS